MHLGKRVPGAGCREPLVRIGGGDEEQSAGCVGARRTAAGSGGCAVALVSAADAEGFTAAVAERYSASSGHTPAVYVCEAAVVWRTWAPGCGGPQTVARQRFSELAGHPTTDGGRRTRTLCGVAVTMQPPQVSTLSVRKIAATLSNNAARPGSGSLTSRRP
jgi:hypothetical protein